MSKSHFGPLILSVAVAAGAMLISSSALLYHMYVAEAVSLDFVEDAEGDVEWMGEYHGMIDVTFVRLMVDGGTLKLTITVKDSVPEHLREGEYALWAARIILLDEHLNFSKAYDVCVEINSTVNRGELVGYFREMGSEESKPCTVERDGNSLSIFATLDGLEDAREIQWSVLAIFERWSGSELLASGFDSAPDEGLQRMILKET